MFLSDRATTCNQELDMARGTDEVFADALGLPMEARAELARSLLASLEGEEEELDASELAAEWREEIARRAAEIDTGEVELIPGDVVFREAFERLQAVRERRSGGT
jgi:putative addiction module component (TIGR02574 family)